VSTGYSRHAIPHLVHYPREKDKSGHSSKPTILQLLAAAPPMVDRLEITLSLWSLQRRTDVDFSVFVDKLRSVLGSKGKSSLNYARFKLARFPFLTGKLSVWYKPNCNSIGLRAHLCLNPTRRLRAMLQSDSGIDDRRASLDNNDNWVRPGILSRFSRQEIPDLLTTCVLNVLDELVHELTLTAADSWSQRTDVLSLPSISVQRIEIYRDVCINDALTYVLDAKPAFFSYFQSPSGAQYPVPVVVESINRNSLVLTGKLREGEEYVIYAKTLGVVRFETRFYKRRVRELCESNTLGLNPVRSIPCMIKILGEHSAETFGSLPLRECHTAERKSSVELLYRWSRACADYDRFVCLMRQLLSNDGRVVCDRHSAKLISRLRDKGLLKPAARGVYRMSAADLQNLRSAADLVLARTD